MGCCNSTHQTESPFQHKKNKMVKRILYNKRGSCIIQLDKVLIRDHMGSLRKNRVRSEYLFQKSLGEGAYGSVQKVVHKVTSQKRACKVIPLDSPNEIEVGNIINEIEILRQLDHPNIIKIVEYFYEKPNFYLVTEICSGGEVFEKIFTKDGLPESQAALIMRQLLSAVYYCHSKNVVHKDLKPENILLENNSPTSPIKLIDFGTSSMMHSGSLQGAQGTAYYIAPEVLQGNYDQRCDIWSCGVILFVMLSGEPPFEGSNEEEIIQNVIKGEYSLKGPRWDQVSEEAKQLVKALMTYSPDQRISITESLKCDWLWSFDKQQNREEENKQALQRCLDKIMSFRTLTKLQEVIYRFSALFMMSSEERKDGMSSFQLADVNLDGSICLKELEETFLSAGLEVDRTQLAHQFQLISQGSSEIGFMEWVIATSERHKIFSQKKKDLLFKMLDQDGSKSISIAELKERFGGDNIHNQVWAEIVLQHQTAELSNNEKEISYNQFQAMLDDLL